MVKLYKRKNPCFISISFMSLLAAVLAYSFSCILIPTGEVYGQASVAVTPTCGPSPGQGGEGHEEGEGFNIIYNATGFSPSGLVHWKLFHSNGSEAINQFGSFETDVNGGFSEPTYIGEGLSPDVYTIYFFDDLNNDGTRDPGGAESSATVSIPCR
jgi:hypothetical protein